jgi:hypothetical protein
MAFRHFSGIANDIPDFFLTLELLLQQAGWIHVAGTGTTDIVYRSTGEAGTLTKLYVRIWRDVNPDRIYYRVQDDAAGTHNTGNPTQYPVAPGLGAIPFSYWATADKDCVTFAIKSGGSYSGCWLGWLLPFSLAVMDQEYHIGCLAPHGTYAKVLRRFSGAWNYTVTWDYISTGYAINPVDNAYTVFGSHLLNAADNTEIYGQPKYISGKIATGAGVNPEDTIDSGYPAATSSWIVMGTAANRWAMSTSAPLPLGIGDGAFQFATGTAADETALFTAMETVMTGLGWTCQNTPGGIYAIDRIWSSLGESGVDAIFVRAAWDAAQNYIRFASRDDMAGTHETTQAFINIAVTDWPVFYYFAADLDCAVLCIELLGVLHLQFAGMMHTLYIDPDSVSTPYKLACLDFDATTWRILRAPNGAWNQVLSLVLDNYPNSSPNQSDGTTFILWPIFYNHTSAPVGSPKYVYRLSSTHLSVRDTVAIGAQNFMYLGNDYAMRIA